jgi:DNA invertase Pin-like site-specific DNA recombinase
MLSTARSGKIGKVIAVKVDRIARSLQDLLEIAGKLGNYNVDLEFTDQDVDISSSQGKLMFQILGAFAEYELKIVGERTKAGLRRAKNEGKKLGRPKIHGSKAVKVMSLMEEHPDWGYRRIALEVGISPASVTRIVKRVSKRGSEKSPGSTTGIDTVSKSSVLETEVS